MTLLSPLFNLTFVIFSDVSLFHTPIFQVHGIILIGNMFDLALFGLLG